MSDCLFCAIATGDIPADIVSSSDDVVVFRDIHPQAPTHILAIPRDHYGDVASVATQSPTTLSDMLAQLTATAAELGVTDGYRIVFNTGVQGGQTVGHVHAHLLGGRQMIWPPG